MRACRLPPAGPEEDAHKPAEEAGDGPGPAVQVTPASGIARFLLSDASSIQPGVTGVCEMGLMPDSELPVHPCGRQGGSRAAPSTPALAGLLCSFRRWRPPPPPRRRARQPWWERGPVATWSTSRPCPGPLPRQEGHLLLPSGPARHSRDVGPRGWTVTG